MLDTDSKDLVTVHTDGNEQLSVMSYGPGVVMTTDTVFLLQKAAFIFCYVKMYILFISPPLNILSIDLSRW